MVNGISCRFRSRGNPASTLLQRDGKLFLQASGISKADGVEEFREELVQITCSF